MRPIQRLLLAVLIMLGALSVLGVRPAQAFFHTWAFNDSFEGTPANVWRIETYPSTTQEIWGGFYTEPSVARSGSNYAFLSADRHNTASWSAVGRPVTINTLGGFPFACTAGFYVWPAYGSIVHVRVEVINPNNNAYIKYKDYSVDFHNTGYQSVRTDAWQPGQANIYVRVALSGGNYWPNSEAPTNLWVDDMSVNCSYL